MHIIIYFEAGFQLEGIVLAIAGDTMRVAIRDWDDAAEFQRLNNQWYAENGDAVRIDLPEYVPGGPQIILESPDETVQLTEWVN